MAQMLGTKITCNDYRLLVLQAYLAEHFIESYWIKGRLWILDASTYSGPLFHVKIDEWIDATDWDKSRLWSWLGY